MKQYNFVFTKLNGKLSYTMNVQRIKNVALMIINLVAILQKKKKMTSKRKYWVRSILLEHKQKVLR